MPNVPNVSLCHSADTILDAAYTMTEFSTDDGHNVERSFEPIDLPATATNWANKVRTLNLNAFPLEL